MKESTNLLLKIRHKEKLVETYIEEKERLYTQATHITQRFDKEPVQGGNDCKSKIESVIPDIVELQDKIDKHREELSKAESIVLDVIADMDKDDAENGLIYATIIIMYYLQGKTLEQCGEGIGYTYQWICEKRNRAIELFDSIYQRKKGAGEI